MDLEKSAPIDVLNITHEDVLQLYRGWRRSEGQLKDKNKELGVLRKRIEQLQEAHVKFSGQIQALKSVKELTVNLQTQLSSLQQENIQLTKENAVLYDKNRALEKEVKATEEKHVSVLRETQIETAIVRGRCQELTAGSKNIEGKFEEEQAARFAVEKRLESTDAVNESLRQENEKLKDELLLMTRRVSQCDTELAHASGQLTMLSQEVSSIANTQERLTCAESEVGILKGDIARLLHLMEHHNVAQGFLNHWGDSGPKGMTFIGLPKKKGTKEAPASGNGSSGRRKAAVRKGSAGKGASVRRSGDSTGGNNAHSSRDSSTAVHDRDSDSDNDSRNGEDSDENLISAAEYAHLQRLHGGSDPFPITQNWGEELDAWAPHELVSHGFKLVEHNMPHVSRAVILDFIGSMNKIWLRRERRKVNRIKERYDKSIAEMQRQMKQLKPYREVIAEATVKRLQTQVHNKVARSLKGRAKSFHELTREERNYFNVEDEYGDLDDEDNPALAGLPRHERKLCQLPPKGSRSHIRDLSTNKLLIASLESLETMGKQQQQQQQQQSDVHGSSDSFGPASTRSRSPRGGRYGSYAETTDDEYTEGHGQQHRHQPSAEFLRGALWLGRNFVTLTEDLSSAMEALRVRGLKDISLAMQDTDRVRACHRLSLLANSVVTDYTSLVHRVGFKSREMLQGASALTPGDFRGYSLYLQQLPIESQLEQKAGNGNQYVSDGSNSAALSAATASASATAVRSSGGGGSRSNSPMRKSTSPMRGSGSGVGGLGTASPMRKPPSPFRAGGGGRN